MRNLRRLKEIRDEIVKLVMEADLILRTDHPKEREKAYSFWIPQSITAMRSDPRWLDRGDYSMDKTISEIENG
jgi:hypothetical protein